MSFPSRLRVFLGLVGFLAALHHGCALAQADVGGTSFPVVMLSDLHFDPFHDPAKVPRLVKAPAEAWEEILRQPDSASQEADFTALQTTCHARGTDAPYALIQSALRAAKAHAPNARFVTVSGDLIVHELDCRYRAALHLDKAAKDDESVSAAFAEKATVFVMRQVESTFAGKPVYLALGNNDSRCNHNRLDVRDAYLKATAQAAIAGLVGASPAERARALETYESAGYYAVTLPAPMKETRLLVLDDTYMMAQYANCEADEKDRKGAEEQLAWLVKELSTAQEKGERVWVIGHVPPTVNPLHSLTHEKAFCASGTADSFLSSDALSEVLVRFADVVKLGLFGHTHMDELHLLGTGELGVPVKVVASVSPVDGNRPTFTVGTVAAQTAALTDYTLYQGSNTTGLGTAWSKEYGFDETYRQTSFSSGALSDLIGKFHADRAGTSPESAAYQQHFFPGGGLVTLGISAYWSGYTCSLDHPDAPGFKACVCGTKRERMTKQPN